MWNDNQIKNQIWDWFKEKGLNIKFADGIINDINFSSSCILHLAKYQG
jgi:hypothetical protein